MKIRDMSIGQVFRWGQLPFIRISTTEIAWPSDNDVRVLTVEDLDTDINHLDLMWVMDEESLSHIYPSNGGKLYDFQKKT